MSWRYTQLSGALDTLRSELEGSAVSTQDPEKVRTRWQQLDQPVQSLSAMRWVSADVFELAGRSALLGADYLSAAPGEQIQHLRTADRQFRAAIALRPSSALAWLNLTRVQFDLDKRSGWRASLSAAFDRGLRGRSSQVELLALRQRLGARLDQALRVRADAMLEQAVRDAPEVMVAAAIRYGYGPQVCASPVFVNSTQVQGYCTSYLR